ncbi:hypothetical protein IMZ48_31820 [Candidatus Bathyarchaeota archaeon]|nr:hypothetical protein [Candidatus Bathyarchaeota archaeon]
MVRWAGLAGRDSLGHSALVMPEVAGTCPFAHAPRSFPLEIRNLQSVQMTPLPDQTGPNMKVGLGGEKNTDLKDQVS